MSGKQYEDQELALLMDAKQEDEKTKRASQQPPRPPTPVPFMHTDVSPLSEPEETLYSRHTVYQLQSLQGYQCDNASFAFYRPVAVRPLTAPIPREVMPRERSVPGTSKERDAVLKAVKARANVNKKGKGKKNQKGDQKDSSDRANGSK